MSAMGFRQSRHHGAQGGFGEPFGGAAAKHAIAQGALASDHQYGPLALSMSAQDIAGQGGPGAVLVKSVQIDRAGGGLAPANQAAVATRFKRDRRRA